MLASVLKSPKARIMNIAIVRAFIALREFAVQYGDLLGQIKDLRDKVGNHDKQLNAIYAAIEKLLQHKVRQETWENRNRIGFNK
jgi:hypothetical protein